MRAPTRTHAHAHAHAHAHIHDIVHTPSLSLSFSLSPPALTIFHHVALHVLGHAVVEDEGVDVEDEQDRDGVHGDVDGVGAAVHHAEGGRHDDQGNEDAPPHVHERHHRDVPHIGNVLPEKTDRVDVVHPLAAGPAVLLVGR